MQPGHLTLVAYYGDKPAALTALIVAVQDLLSQTLQDAFIPRPPAQVHATITSLGRVRPIEWTILSDAATIDFDGLLRHLCTTFQSQELVVQFGGFENRDYSVSSRGMRLYDRSFVHDRGNSILIGWPVLASEDGATPTYALDTIRRSGAAFGAVHEYHVAPRWVDPDLHMVIGQQQSTNDYGARQVDEQLKQRLRAFLLENRTMIDLRASALSWVLYENRALPLDSSIALPLCDLERVRKAIGT